MEVLNTILPIIIDVLLIVLLVVGIILVIKCIYIIDKTKSVVTNIEEKVNSLNSLFAIVSLVNDKISGAADTIISWIEGFIVKLFNKSEEDEVIEVEVVENETKKKKGKK